MGVLLGLVIGVLLLAWLAVFLVILANVGIAAAWVVGRVVDRPGRFADADAQFLRHLGIRL